MIQQMHQNSHRDIKLQNNDLFNLYFYSESKHKLIDQYIDRSIKEDRQKNHQSLVIFTPNPEQVMLSNSDPQFLAALRDADILIPDGVGLLVASSLLAAFGKAPAIKERISGIDLAQSLIHQFPKENAVIIGGRVADHLVSVPQTLRVGERTIAWLAGYVNVQQPTEAEEKAVEAFIRTQKPTIVFVAFGAPFQEYWSLRHRAFLEKQGVRVILVVGGAVDVLAGKLKRAPRFVRSLGLEWLFRLVQEPWRWKRQLNLLRFIGLTFQEIFKS